MNILTLSKQKPIAKCKRLYGFTLVELSIVLVIIGLLIGGILVGQSLINSAKISRQIQQIQQIEIAVTQFKNKFNCLPGDCTNVAGSGVQPDRLRAGNSDGMIFAYGGGNIVPDANRGWGTFTTYSSEWASVFDHLAVFNMYPMATYDETTTSSNRAGVAYPKMEVDNGSPYTKAGVTPDKGGIAVGWQPAMDYIRGGHKIVLGICNGNSVGLADAGTINSISFFCGPSLQDMKALDAKLDDGRPYSGRAYLNSDHYLYRIPNSSVGGDATSNVGNSTTNQYKATAPSNCSVQGCYAMFMIEADF